MRLIYIKYLCYLLILNSSCVQVADKFGKTNVFLPLGLVAIGAVMILASMIRMIFKGLEKEILIFFIIGVVLFLVG